jgi:3-dehydroquinate dehydratase/shikimate dehydrogenase
MVVAEHQALAERGAELIELRLDWLSKIPSLERLIGDRPTPVVVTCRNHKDKGRWRFDEEQRLTILRAAIVAGVEYIDLEDTIADKIPRYGDTQRIISHHNFDETPEHLADIHADLCRHDPDIVKLVTMANCPHDAVRMLQLVESSSVLTIGFCMGELGVPSRILCGKYGSPFTYATFSSERELAPGQLSFDDMKNLYRYDEINSETEVYGVIGDPIAHSMSPLLHNRAFQKEKMNRVYLPLRVPKGNLAGTLKDYRWLGIKGYSVTIPHKKEAMSAVDHCDEITQDIGAANTLFREADGQWHATNTDFDAALNSIRVGLKEGGASSDNLEGKQVLMLGAGGVARAIGLGLVRAGAAVTISNRTHKRAQELAIELGCQQTQWENRGAVYADILINCTAVGMHPLVDNTPYEQNWLRESTLVFDTVYNPENTLLIKQAKLRGCPTVSGIEMFIRQAAAQFECFTNTTAPLDKLRETLRHHISPVSYSD